MWLGKYWPTGKIGTGKEKDTHRVVKKCVMIKRYEVIRSQSKQFSRTREQKSKEIIGVNRTMTRMTQLHY